VVQRARTSDTVDAFPFPRNKRDQERERYTPQRVFVNTCFSSDFASPPSFSPIEIRTRKKDKGILLSFFRLNVHFVVVVYIVLTNYVYLSSPRCEYHRSGSFIGISRSYSSRDSTGAERRSNSITKKLKKKRESKKRVFEHSQRVVKKERRETYRLCPLLERTRRRESKARKVCSWCVNGSKCARGWIL